jgi:hypothetical protein
LWVAVGVAITIFIKKNGIIFSEIMNSENICLKVRKMNFIKRKILQKIKNRNNNVVLCLNLKNNNKIGNCLLILKYLFKFGIYTINGLEFGKLTGWGCV